MRNFQWILAILLLVFYFSPKADARIRKDLKGRNSKEVQFGL